MIKASNSIFGNRPMSRGQTIAVGLALVLNAIDGFDVLAITFAAPGIADDWGISKSTLGIVLSAGLAGMAAGSLLVSPLADKFGRRPMVLGCLSVMTLGMFLSATAPSVVQLAFWRFVTGIGIGSMLASVNAVAAEFANDHRRDLAVTLMAAGYPIGGLVGGLIAAGLVQVFDWRAIFIFGGFLSLVCIPLVLWKLPESLEFLATQRSPDALGRVNTILRRLGHEEVDRLQPMTDAEAVRGYRDLFAPSLINRTAIITGVYFLHILAFYFFTGWLPKLVNDMGFAASTGITMSALVSVGGIAGSLLIGFLSPRFGLQRLLLLSLLCTAGLMALFAMLPINLPTLALISVLIGICIFGGVVGLYALAARAFPTRLRVSGTGLVIGIGRGGAVIGPMLGGVLLDAGLSTAAVVGMMGLASAAAALLLMMLATETAGGYQS